MREIRTFSVAEQIKIGKQAYETMRDQYVYSKRVTSPTALGKIWGCSRRMVEMRISRSEGTADDWRKSREKHRAEVAKSVLETVQADAIEETEGSIATFQAVLGMLTRHAATGAAKKDLSFQQTLGYARCLKILADLYDQLSGYGRIQQIAESRRVENTWFLGWAIENIGEPEKLKNLARSMRDRMIAFGHVSTDEYGSVLDVAREAKAMLGEAAMEIRRVAEGKVGPAHDVTPKRSRKRVKRPDE